MRKKKKKRGNKNIKLSKWYGFLKWSLCPKEEIKFLQMLTISGVLIYNILKKLKNKR